MPRTKPAPRLRDRILDLRRIPARDLQDHQMNWRTHPQAQRDALQGVLSDLGIASALLVYDSPRQGGLCIIDGHLRKSLDPAQEWPCLLLDLDDDEATYLLATHDPLGAMAEASREALAHVLEQVHSGQASVQQLLSDLAEQHGVIPAETQGTLEDVEPQIDRVAELRAQWGVEPGQLWALGEHRVLCGDCTDKAVVERLLEGQPIATLIFDPPYDGDTTLVQSRWPAEDVLLFTDHRHLLDCVDGWGQPFRCLFCWDGVTSWYTPGWPLARGKFCLWFGTSPYTPDGAHYGMPGEAKIVSNPRGTYAYVPDPRGKHLATVFQAPTTQEQGGHPHSKPVDWVRLLLANCTQGEVYDHFLGSGTTLIACEHLHRLCYGIEIDPGYVAVTLQRWFDLTGKQPTLVEG